METAKTVALFVITVLAEIVGCYLPNLWLKERRSAWLLIPAALSLAAFAWLLTLHPTAAGRVYAAYGGVYVTIAILWLWKVDGVTPSRWDLLGVLLCLSGMAVIIRPESVNDTAAPIDCCFILHMRSPSAAVEQV